MKLEEFRTGWMSGLPETPCGKGSTLEATVIQRKAIADWAERFYVETVVDIGAGDLHWIKHIQWVKPVKYVALDLVPRHPDVQTFDLRKEIAPPADMVLCLWVLNHLPEDEARKAADNLLFGMRKISSLVYTWWPGMPDYLDFGFNEAVIIKPGKQAEIRLLRC